MTKTEMSLTKCPVCGGALGKETFGKLKCLFCDEIIEINYKDIDLWDSANKLREENSFERALEKYVEILKENPTFADAYWWALLSEYGIEYIEDGGKEIPTIHKPVTNYLIEENNYAKNVLRFTQDETKEYYAGKIKELGDLQKRILEGQQDFPKYHVFISALINKVGKDDKKTEEFSWAKQIYKTLSNRGLRVFFSDETLPSSKGNYEHIIYNALQNTQYLIVLASDIEHLNNKWIKSEWERFLRVKKDSIGKGETRYFKLIAPKKVANDASSQLKEAGDFTEYDDQDKWLSSLLKEISEIFAEIEDSKNRAIKIEKVNVGKIKVSSNKKLEGTEAIYKPSADLLRNPKNPYLDVKDSAKSLPSLRDLEEDNFTNYINIVRKFVEKEDFDGAERDLNNYVRENSCYKEHYDVLILRMLINSKSKNLEEFFEEKVDVFSQSELIEKIILNLEKKGADFLSYTSNYILSSIRSAKENTAVDFYEIIAKNIKDKIVDSLHDKIGLNLPYLYGVPELFMRYSEIALPYVARKDIERYVELVQELLLGLCKCGAWDEAENLLNWLKKADPQNEVIQRVSLLIEYKAKSFEELLDNIELEKNFFEIEDLIKNLYESGVLYIVNSLKARVLKMMRMKKYAIVENYLEILVKVEFEGKEDFFKGIIEESKNIPESGEVFRKARSVLSEEDKKYFTSTTITMIQNLINVEAYIKAKEYCKELYQYEGQNKQVLMFYLYAELETRDYNYTNINKLESMEVVEQIVLLNETKSSREEFLNTLLNACVKYLDGEGIQSDDIIFNVFEKLLRYYEELNTASLKKRIEKFAEKCLQQEFFDNANRVYRVILGIDNYYHQAYWGLILANNSCKNDDELILSKVPIKGQKEFNFAMENAQKKGDTEAEDRYAGVSIKQQKEMDKKKKSSKAIVFSILFVLAVGVATVLYILLK